MTQARESGKPENVLAKIVEGKINKFSLKLPFLDSNM
jgi:translation elongation factor EF-Ts